MYIALLIIILALLLLYFGSLNVGLTIAIAVFALGYFLREFVKYTQRIKLAKTLRTKYEADLAIPIRYFSGKDFLHMQSLVLLADKKELSLVAENHKHAFPREYIESLIILKQKDINIALENNSENCKASIPVEVLKYWQSLKLPFFQEFLAIVFVQDEELEYHLLGLRPNKAIRDKMYQFMPLKQLCSEKKMGDEIVEEVENTQNKDL